MSNIIRLSLPATIASLLGKREHEEYRDVGQLMNAKDLYTLIGLTGSPMLYNYMSGKTKTIDPERAVVILDKFNILVDEWLDETELKADATNKELSAQIAREPIRAIIEEIVAIEGKYDDTEEGLYVMRKNLRKLIARYY